MIARSPKEAKALGLDRYHTGKPCKHGHVADRRVGDRACVDCGAAKQRAHYERNRDEYLERQRDWQQANRDKTRAASKNWKDSHADRVKAYQAQYARDNAETLSEAARQRRLADPEKHREWQRRWAENNRGRKNALTAAYAKHVKLATPRWLTNRDWAEITARYEEAVRASQETGAAHQVDHIIPLRGEWVSGLHVPENLRVISAAENARKKNAFLPELLERNGHEEERRSTQ
jgi:hypothetical protein